MLNPLTPVFNVISQIHRYHTLNQCFDDSLKKQKDEDHRQQCEFENCKTIAREIDKRIERIREYFTNPSPAALHKERTHV